MKDHKFFITPNMTQKLDIDYENIDYERLTSKEHHKEFKKSKAYKYVKRTLDREKAHKIQARNAWWKENLIQLLGLLFAFIAAVPVILQAIVYILSKLV